MSEHGLTESQKTCLRLVGAGMSSKEIAVETGLSPQTIDQYLRRAAQALGTSNRREAARMLAEIERGGFKKSELKSPAVDPEPVSDTMSPASPVEPAGLFGWFFGWVPPLGGDRDELSAKAKIEQIVKAALLAAVVFGSIVASGAWLQSLFT